MIWVAIEDANTHEVTEFEKVTEKKLLYLIDGYRVDKNNGAKFRVQDIENGQHIVYLGITYKGGFGYNLLVASKYMEL